MSLEDKLFPERVLVETYLVASELDWLLLFLALNEWFELASSPVLSLHNDVLYSCNKL